MTPTLVALAQLTSTSDAEANTAMVHTLVARAARRGAKLVVTPENTNFLGPHAAKVRRAETLQGPFLADMAGLARTHGIYLLVGSFNERSDDPVRCYNTSVLISPAGEQVAVYRKVHLFDVDVSDAVRFKESDTVVPGTDLTVAQTTVGAIGMSVCYDLRFPGLYGQLVAQGAQMIAIPSAFTMNTGKDHWEPLLRARAIETQSYVLAANQCGHHDDGGLRESYGQSMIVDPWGHVLARCADGPGLCFAEIDLDRVAQVRQAMPVAEHRRF